MEPSATLPHATIAVIGAGYVGLVSAVGLAGRGHPIEVVENDPNRLAALRRGEVPFSEPGLQEALTTALDTGALTILARIAEITAEIALICVGTPIDDQGHADMRAVESVLSELPSAQSNPIVVVRSTMPVGTSERLLRDGHVADASRFFSVPEFLRQGAALADFGRPHRVVIGRTAGADPAAEASLIEVFGTFDAPLLLVTLEEAELIKNGANAFLALKISFANELAGLAERSGAEVGRVIEGIGLDPRIGATYMNPSFGFGGSCLPKELQTIAMSGIERGLEMHVTAAAMQANLAHQRLFAERVDAVVGGVSGRHVALLGLAFKANTDDTRSSPAIALARWLLGHGARVTAYDPAAGARAAHELPDLAVCDSAMDAVTGAVACVIATEWTEFRDLDWRLVRDRMAAPVIVDGRRLLDPDVVQGLGFRYERLGTPSRDDADRVTTVA